MKKHLRSSSYENNILNSLWCRSLMMKTINNRPKDELVSDQSGRGETNDVEATGMKNDRACAKFAGDAGQM